MIKNNKKLFIIRKYVYAEDAQDAIKKEKKQGVSDCWVDEEWKKKQLDNNNKIGF
jgi:hypothetical protein